MSKTLLVTGGFGFIGSHVVDLALARGFHVVIFDRKGKRRDGCETVLGDLRDAESVNEAVKAADYAINLGGLLGTQEMMNDCGPAIATNIQGAVNFLKACMPTAFHRVCGVQIGVGNHWMDNPYSITKSTALRFVRMFNHEHGTRVAMVRALNAYGERQKHKPIRKILPTFIVRALRGEPIEVYGDGEQVMDMVYVKDVAAVLLDACTSHAVEYDFVYEIGTGRRTTVNWVAEQVIAACGSKSEVVHTPMRAGEEPHAVVVADTDTLITLGDYNFRAFEDAIGHVVAWYREHYEWQSGALK